MPLLHVCSVKFKLTCTIHTVLFSYLNNFSYSNDFENEKYTGGQITEGLLWYQINHTAEIFVC